VTNKPENQSANLASGIIEAMNQLRAGFMQTVTRPHCIHRSYVGYFRATVRSVPGEQKTKLALHSPVARGVSLFFLAERT